MALVAVLGATPSRATYSIAACDPETGQCGVAVQTDNLAVGASVPSVVANVGAIVSQLETHPGHGPRGMELLRQGRSATEVVSALLSEDDGFEGRGPEARQLAVVAAAGGAAVHTGGDAAASPWVGSRTGERHSVQGNGLAGPDVLHAVEKAFLETSGPLAARLLAGLVAGDAAGGQRSGRQSAALQYLALAFAQSPERAPVVLGRGDFAELGAEPAFRRWVGEDLRLEVVSDVATAVGRSSAAEIGPHVRRLLEVGEPRQALRLLEARPPPAASDAWLLRATVHDALGDREAARTACQHGLRDSPGDPRLRRRLEALRAEQRDR